MLILKYSLFFMMLLLISIRDIMTRVIPNYYHVAIMLIGLIDFHPLFSLTGMLAALLFLIAAVITNGKWIGGADVKFMATAGFVMGWYKATTASIIGLSLLVLYVAIRCGIQKMASYPLLPFLSIGCAVKMFIK